MSQLERVPAARLRPGDILYACETTCELDDTKAGTDRVLLVTNSRRFTVPHSTHFRRLIRSHRINMRPDLGSNRRGEHGVQRPDQIASRIRHGYRG